MAKQVLGKGLNAIFEDADTLLKTAMNEPADADAVKDAQKLRISLLEPNKEQPRKNFDEEALAELAQSIGKHGVLQPVLVRKTGKTYEIIAGERRWRAAKLAGLKEVPVIIKDLSDEESSEIALVENLQREDLSPVEEARAYRAMIEKFGLKQEEVAARVAKNRTTVTNSLRLLQLDNKILQLLEEKKLSAGHARCLLSLSDHALQQQAAERIISEGLSVREAEKITKTIGNKKKTKNNKQEKNRENNTDLEALSRDMTDRLGLKVRITEGKDGSGKLEISYYSQEDLNRLAEKLM